MQVQAAEPVDRDRMLTVEEAARTLGIGRTLAYELIRNDEWPTVVVRIGRLLRIPKGPLLDLIRTGRCAQR